MGKPRESLLQVIEMVSRAYGIDVGDICGPRRHKTTAEARMVVYWLARQMGLSYPEIGFQLGRDHTTVMSGVRNVKPGTRAFSAAYALAEQLGLNGRQLPGIRFRIEAA